MTENSDSSLVHEERQAKGLHVEIVHYLAVEARWSWPWLGVLAAVRLKIDVAFRVHRPVSISVHDLHGMALPRGLGPLG